MRYKPYPINLNYRYKSNEYPFSDNRGVYIKKISIRKIFIVNFEQKTVSK